jgi:hypothetical protein
MTSQTDLPRPWEIAQPGDVLIWSKVGRIGRRGVVISNKNGRVKFYDEIQCRTEDWAHSTFDTEPGGWRLDETTKVKNILKRYETS